MSKFNKDEKLTLEKYITDNFSRKHYVNMHKFTIWALIGMLIFLIIGHQNFDTLLQNEIPNQEWRHIFKALVFFIIMYLIDGFIFQLYRN